MNFPSTNEMDGSRRKFEMTFDQAIALASESPAEPATAIVLVIPRKIKFEVYVEKHSGAMCFRIPVGEST